MFKVYPAIFHSEDGAFWVEFPDLPGCQSYGATLEEVTEGAAEALGLYLYAQAEQGAGVPAPSDIRAITAPVGGFTSVISCDPRKYEKRTKAVKKTLTIPEWLNDEAEKRNINFSATLTQALLQKIE